jgi:polar amino acid transport system substrate-binding protein
MKQLSQNLRTGKLTVAETPPPTPQPGCLLVASAYSLISAGTERSILEIGKKSLLGKAMARPDRVRQVLQSLTQQGFKATYEKVRSRLDASSPLGYSAAGQVIAVGEGVLDYRVGDRVACGGSSAAHAEIISVPVNLCAPLPAGVEMDEAAFTTVGAIALQGIRLARPQIGECVVVIGLGLLGSLTVQMLRAAGCIVLGLDLSPARCQLALELGAHAAVSDEAGLRAAILRETENKGADRVIITAGTTSNRPVELAGEISREKGRVVVVGAVGLHLPRSPYYDKELEFCISRSYGPGRYDPAYEEKGIDYPYGYVRWTENRNMRAFLRMIAERKVSLKPLITHTFPIQEAVQAYDLISEKLDQPFLGVLFQYPHSAVPADDQPNRPAGSAPMGSRQEKISLGVIGAGNFAQSMLLPHLHADLRVSLARVVNQTPLHAMDVKERFHFAAAGTAVDEVLCDEQTSAVLIATRHDSHADLACQALRAGKPLFIEKPLAMDEAELVEVEKAYHAADAPFLMVGFNRRFAPAVQSLRRFFAPSREPKLITYRINAGYIPLDHWTQDLQRGGGRIVGEVCHFVDLLGLLASSRLVSVYAQALPDLGKYRLDNLAVILRYADGTLGNLIYAANGDKALPKEYLEIYSQGLVGVLRDFREVSLIGQGKSTLQRFPSQDKGHKAEMDAFVSSLAAAAPEPVPFAEALAATRATFAILQSIQSGAPVPIP